MSNNISNNKGTKTDRKEKRKEKELLKVKRKQERNQRKATWKNYNIFKVKGEFALIPLIINILIPLVGGAIVGYINKNTMTTYDSLIKPAFSPPSIVFPIVWTILYILMGIAAYRIYLCNRQGKDDDGAYFIYLIQLICNFLWPFLFFTFRLYGVSFIWLIVIFILAIITFIKFLKVDKIAAYLLVPYLIWLAFAAVLNFFAWKLNEM